MMLDPEEFLDRLRELLGKSDAPDSEDPNDYPTHAEIRNDDCLMLIAEMKHLRQRADRLASEMDETLHELGARKSRLYRQLEDLYPEVRLDTPKGGTGVRRWEGKHYFVGWSAKKQNSS